MCGKRCAMECSAKEPASVPRKGGGTANLGVYMSLSPIHPHHCPPLGRIRLVAQQLWRIIDHHAGSSKPRSAVSLGRYRQTFLKSVKNRNVLSLDVSKGKP